jgi:hypothetical protein
MKGVGHAGNQNGACTKDAKLVRARIALTFKTMLTTIACLRR